MRIWHDNSGKGKFGCWYLNYVVVRDVQTKQRYHFVVNQWLAVEEDDGQVTVVSVFIAHYTVCITQQHDSASYITLSQAHNLPDCLDCL